MDWIGIVSVYTMNTGEFTSFLSLCSSHVGSRSHCCGGPGFGCMLPLLSFQKMLWEEEEAKESEREEDRPSQKRKGRGRRGWREGVLFPVAHLHNNISDIDLYDDILSAAMMFYVAGGGGEEGRGGRGERTGEAG